jgi:outer membrane biosynthesis protein TonB
MACTKLQSSSARARSLAKQVALVSVFALPFWLRAQTAEDYFHGGATNYVFGDKAKAKEQIVTGLQSFPSDPKLSQLLALLKKEEEQKQQQQQQEQQQKNDQKKDQKDQNQKQDSQKKDSDQKKEQNQSDEQKKEQDKKQEAQKKKAERKKQEKKEQQTGDQKKEEDPSDQKDEQEPQQAYAPGQMTPQQAKQLLDAQKGDEMIMPVRPQVKPRDASKPLKDW